MDEKEIISIIENEFNDLSINNLINELKKIPQYDYKSINTFILKLFRDIDTATKNLKNRFKKYFQNLKSQNSQIIKKIYFQSRNKPLISIYNTKDSTNMNEDLFYKTQTKNDYDINYDNIQSIKNLKSSEENSFNENDNIFTKNNLEMKYFSGNNGVKRGGIKFKKKINLGNKSLSEFKVKTKQKISLNEHKPNNYTIYKIYNKAHNNKNKDSKKDNNNNNNKSNSINNNKIELNLNNNNKENYYFSNIKVFKHMNLKKKNSSYEKKAIKNKIKLINNNNLQEKKEYINQFNNMEKNNNYNNTINEKSLIIKEKNPFKNDNNNINNNIIKGYNNINNNNNTTIIINCHSLSKDIINFIDNMKDLQRNIVNKNPNIKELKYNFEKNKYLLYQKALKISHDINDILIKKEKEDKLNFNKSNQISKINSFLIKKSLTNNMPGNDATQLDNTKELNLSINNLRKSIEDIKNNSKFLTELKTEVNNLNNKLKEKNEKEKEYEKIINEYIISIQKVYKILLSHFIKQYNILNSLENQNNSSENTQEKQFNWYINEISKYVNILLNKHKNNDTNIVVNENTNINNSINKSKKDEISQIGNDKNNNELKNELCKNIIEIINMINPFLSKEKDNLSQIKELENENDENKIKKLLEVFKSNIKEIINLIDNLKKEVKNKENEKEKINKNNKNNNKINISFDEENEGNLSDKNNFLQLNSTLLGIQNDLIKKIENKQEEIETIKKDLKDSLQLNKEFMNIAKNQNGQDVNIFAEKYKYLLNLFNAEQEKVKFWQNEYMNLLNELSNYIKNGKEIIIELKKMWNLNPIIKTNFEIAEPEFPDIDPINETDLLTEKS